MSKGRNVLFAFPSGPLKPVLNPPEQYYDSCKKDIRILKSISRKLKRKRTSRKVVDVPTPRIYGLPFDAEKRKYYRGVYLKSSHWKELRARKILEQPTCQHCGASKRVEPHHIRYKNLYDVLTEDLITLCRACHIKEHKKIDTEKRAAKVPPSGLNPRQGMRRWRSMAEFRKMPVGQILGVEAECKITGPVLG